MFKRFIINLVLAALMFLILIYALYSGEYTVYHFTNGLFVVGIIMFSGGILSISNAGQLFRGIGFIFKKMFNKKYSTTTYFDYVQTRELEKQANAGPIGWPALMVGIICLAVSIIVSVNEYL